MLEPKLLLLDEPLSALDPNLRKQVRSELKALQRRTGITFIFVTHDQEEALSMSDNIALMCKGRIEQIGTPQQLYLQPKTRFAAGFLGSVNWIGPVGVRPEAIRISRQKPDASTRSSAATVETATFLGSSVQIETKLQSGESVVSEISRLDQTSLLVRMCTCGGRPPTSCDHPHEPSPLVPDADLARTGLAVLRADGDHRRVQSAHPRSIRRRNE